MNIEDYFDAHGVRYVLEGQHKHARSGWVQIDCPFCAPDSEKYHMGYNVSNNYVTCWRCGFHPLIPTLAEATGQSYDKVRKDLGGLETYIHSGEPVRRQGKLTLPSPLEPLSYAHRSYLRERGYDPKAIAVKWGVQGLGFAGSVRIPDGERLSLPWRLFIPIHFRSEIVSWTTRTINPKVGLRYISAPAACEKISKKEILYGEDFCGNAAVLVEGPLDVQAGGNGFVASLGTAISSAQVARFSRYLYRGICFDNEPAAQTRARRLLDDLSVLPGKTYNFILDSKDISEDMRTGGKDLAKIKRMMKL